MTCTGLYTGQRPDEVLHLEWVDLYPEANRVMVQVKSHWNWSPKNGKPRPVGPNPDLFTVLENYQADRLEQLRIADQRLAKLQAWERASTEERKSMPRPAELAKYERPPSIKTLIERARGVFLTLQEQIASPLVFSNCDSSPMRKIPNAFGAAVDRAGLGKDGTFYTLRHTFASQLVKAGVDLPTVKELMGHASIVTTMRYAHLAPGHGVDKEGLIPTLTGDVQHEDSGLKRLHIACNGSGETTATA